MNDRSFSESGSFQRPLLHPLGGSNLTTLLDALRKYAPFDRSSFPVRLLAVSAVLLRFPFYRAERIFHERRIQNLDLSADPVFVVGHWRSGTTHLHNLLCQDPQFGWTNFIQTAMPWDFLSRLKIALPIIERFLPDTRGMDNVRLSITSPQEEEMALGNMGSLSYYYCYYFPQHFRRVYRESILFDDVTDEELQKFRRDFLYFIKKLSLSERNQGKRLLLKNPANTARIPLIRSIFQGAKFIHIIRNPFEVFCSTLRHFQRTMSAFAWQEWREIDFDQLTRENYGLMMKRFLQIRSNFDPDSFYELRFEALEENPLLEIEKVYDHFKFPNKDMAIPAIQKYVQEQRNYRKNIYKLSKRQVAQIRRDWDFALDAWNYDLPEGVEVTD